VCGLAKVGDVWIQNLETKFQTHAWCHICLCNYVSFLLVVVEL